MGWDALSVRGGPKYSDFKAEGALTTLPKDAPSSFLWDLWRSEGLAGEPWDEKHLDTLGPEALPPGLLLKLSGLHHLSTKPQSILLAASLPPTFRVLVQ